MVAVKRRSSPRHARYLFEGGTMVTVVEGMAVTMPVWLFAFVREYANKGEHHKAPSNKANFDYVRLFGFKRQY